MRKTTLTLLVLSVLAPARAPRPSRTAAPPGPAPAEAPPEAPEGDTPSSLPGGEDVPPRPRRRRIGLAALVAALCVSTLLGLSAAVASTGLVLVVNDTRDLIDRNVGDRVCRTGANTCTLRAAIQEANAVGGADTIHVPAGLYEIEIPSLNDDLPGTGDFDVTDDVTIVGEAPEETIVDAGWPLDSAPVQARGLDRVLEIHPGARNVTFVGLTLREGYTDEAGGAVLNWSPGTIRFENVHVLDSYASKAGGGIQNADPLEYEWPSGTEPPSTMKGGRIELVDSRLSGNASGSGAAINNASTGTIVIEGSTISDNPGPMIPDPTQQVPPGEQPELVPAPGVYDPHSGAIANEAANDTAGTIRISDSTITRNYATANGAGILNGGAGTVVVERSTISHNTSEAGGGGIYTSSGVLTVSESTFEQNQAHGGGGIYSAGNLSTVGLRGRVDVTGSTFLENSTSEASGGGIHSTGDGQLTVLDSTFTRNDALDAGGGLSSDGRTAVFVARSTFSGNSAYDEGGGAFTASERTVTIQDSLFTHNSAGVPGPEGNDAGGGGLYSETGPLNVMGSTFVENTATEEGGGISLDNHGRVTMSDSVIRGNRAGQDGGGVENSATRVVFERLLVEGNRAELDGGGIYNSSSGEFTILDTTVQRNSGQSGGGLANAPDNHLVVRRSLFYRNTARNPGINDSGEVPEDAGLGGGIYSLADGDALIENTTLSSNRAAVGGGGLFHDADGDVKLVNVTIWRNSAPTGGGIGVVESDFVPAVPPKPFDSMYLRNTIVGGSVQGGSCDWYVKSLGGNVDTSNTCFLGSIPDSDATAPSSGDRSGVDPRLDAIADNGGPTWTHAIPDEKSIAIDRIKGSADCPETDQRGVPRPQNRGCDSGAFEYEGDPPPLDDVPPDTEYISGPTQNSLETVAFYFRGTDETTIESELGFECRLVELDPTEPPEPIAPWDPVPPELWWHSCTSGWSVPLLEEGWFTFEVRAIDNAGNVDPTPALHFFSAMDNSPPDTFIVEKPPLVTNSRSATFTFSGSDNLTPPQFLEYECRLDSRDPDLWLECTNPTFFSNLTTGEHTLEVRAIDGSELMDPTPARYTWTVGQPQNCDQANITLTAVADGWVDQVNPLESFFTQTELTVRSDATNNPAGQPVVGANARALVRFAVPSEALHCKLESATLRLYSESHTDGRTLEAVPLAGTWRESTLTWSNQPGTTGSPAATESGHGYREWDVLTHVNAMREGALANHGWLIRDAVETDPDGGDQSFASREEPQDPPDVTLPQLVLRYEAAGGPPPSPPAAPTVPTTVHCGQVIRESTLVANDLLDCLGEGLVVGASNVMLDLGGHTVQSALPIEPGEEDGLLAGIRVSGHRNVVIRNGTVRGFGYGVMLTSGTTFNVIEDLLLDANVLAGVQLFDADDGRNGNTIRNNTLTSNGEAGINLVDDSENSVVEHNTLDGNAGVGFFLQNARGHRIEGNHVSGIPIDPLLDSDNGARLEGARDNLILNNTMSDSGDAGVGVYMGSHRNRIEGNVLFRNGDAGVIVEDSNDNRIVGNTAHQQSDGGVVLSNAHNTLVRGNDLRWNPSGVEAGGTNNLVVDDNDVSESLQTGIELGNGLNIRVRDNVANLNGGGGISLEGAAFDAAGNPVGGALIQGNTANQNRDNGISVAGGGHRVADNDAHNNAGYGIEADEPVVDGGGNRATGNAEPEQCVGVVCLSDGDVPPIAPDTEAPDTIVLSGPANPTTSDSATFVFTATDNHTPITAMVFECRLDPGPDPEPEPDPDPDPTEPPHPEEPPDFDSPPEADNWHECTSPARYHGLEEGEHHFEVRAIDQAHNKDLSPATHDWLIEPGADDDEDANDTIPPSTTIVSGPADPTSSTSATFRFRGSDNATIGANLRYQCRLDSSADADFELCTSPTSYEGLEAGPHTFEVRAVDRSGNVDATPATHAWTIVDPPEDTEAPETSIDSGPDPVTLLTNATFTFSSNDPTATFECSLDGAEFAACTSPKAFTGLAVGPHELQVRAVDPARNVDESPAAYAWTVSEPPVAAFAFCGQTITRSIKLLNDLADCLGDGLFVGAPGITIDLDGHTVDGIGNAGGIRNDGFDHVTIKNGTIQQFDYGVLLNAGTTHNIVESIRLEQNQEAAAALGRLPMPTDPNLPAPEEPPATWISGVEANTLRNNSLVANKRGIWLTNGTRTTLVRGNDLAATDGYGVWIRSASDNRIEANRIDGASSDAVALEGASRNAIVDNELTHNQDGVALGLRFPERLGSHSNRVARNTLVESGGIEVDESNGNELLDNVVNGAAEAGVDLYLARSTLVKGNDLRANKQGISLKTSSGNRLESNDTSESEGTGIALESLSLDNVVLGNTSSDNDGDGIYVGDETTGGSGVLIQGNRTHNNKNRGIYVPKVSHTIRGNVANDNGSWGMWVSEGSNGRINVDGGGNRAQGNNGPLDPFTLQPQQCFFVHCTGGDAPPTDEFPPETSILEAPANGPSETATFRFSGTDNVAVEGFECRLDSQEESAWAACTSPKTYVLEPGQHTFQVRAVDVAGNVDPTPATHTWLVEFRPAGVPPETTIDSGPDPATTQTSASFAFSADELGATFQCALDGGAFAACASPQAYSGLSVGSHTFRVRAIDAEGLIDETPATWTWTILAPPVPAQVECGEIVVRSIKLMNDLVNCPNHGLIVGASRIAIDLNGHVIDGVGQDAGILNNGNDQVTITNGTILEFDYGVQLNPGTSQNVLHGLRLELNQEAGLALSDADQNGIGNVVHDNTIVSNGIGIAVYSNTRNSVFRNNALGGNAKGGIYSELSGGNRYEANELANNHGGPGIALVGGDANVVLGNEISLSGGDGVMVGEEILGSNSNRIERNKISDNNGAGISVADSRWNEIVFNDVRGSNGAGVILDLARDTLVRGNDLRFNTGAISLSESTGNRIEANNASGGLGSGIELGSLSYNNYVLRNTASANGGGGIEVDDAAPAGMGNVLEENVADVNGGDGIAVFGVGHTLTANIARSNGGWGIYAAVGAIDGGNNFAAGNAEEAQCFGITCIIGDPPGAPDTFIVSHPPNPSRSRNASFTYSGTDATTPLHQLVFECRLDSTNPNDWEDCEYPQEYLNLSPGEHTFQVRAIDLQLNADPTPATYTWVYDPLAPGVAPDTFIDMKPEAETWSYDAIFTFHSDEPDVLFHCQIDNLPWQPCSFDTVLPLPMGAFEWSFEETEAGLHTFRVRATDFEGNVDPTPAEHTWRILGVVTTFLSGPGFTPGEGPGDPPTGGPTLDTTATLDFIANVADATYECSLDFEPFVPCSPPVTYTELAPGEHVLRVVATDLETGISELEAAEYEWEVLPSDDTTPPDTFLDRAPANNSSSTIFEFSGVDNLTPPELLRFECRLDSTNELDWQECTSPYNLLDFYTYQDVQLAPGQHTFEVRAIDDAEPEIPDPSNPNFEGNVDPTPATHTWTMVADTSPPGTAILSGPPATSGSSTAEFEFVGADNATPEARLVFECSVDGGPFEECQSPESVQGLEPGEHTFRVRAVDLAGNVDATPAEYSWTIVPAPVTTISSGPGVLQPDGRRVSTTEHAIFVFAADQPGSTFECSLYGADYAPCESPQAYWIVESGGHKFEVRATNAEGVVEDPAALYEWEVELGPDTTPPDTTILTKPPASTTSTTATFTFTGTDNRTPAAQLTFECSLNSTSSYSSCSSPRVFDDLNRGTQIVRIRARDAAGNVDPTPAAYEWFVAAPPITTILSGPDELTESTTATFTFVSDVPGSTFLCWLDGLLESCTSPKTYTGLAAGEHFFAVLARDPSGTWEREWVEWEWEIGDVTPPITIITEGPDVETESRSATFVFHSEPGVTFECSLNGAQFSPCTSPKQYPRLALGNHRFEVQARTPALIVDPVPTRYEWRIVDLTPPETEIDFGPPASTASTSAYFGFSSDDPTATFECALDAQQFNECDNPAEFTDLARGSHTLRVRAVDQAGNVDLSPEVYSWTITQPPAPNTPTGTNVVVTLPMPDGSGSATITFGSVTTTGATTIEALAGAPPLTGGYANGRTYDISSTAIYGEPIVVCLEYDPSAYSTPAVRLLHYDGEWVDITLTNDPSVGRVCGEAESLSPFAIAAAPSGSAPETTIVSGPENPSSSGTATFTFLSDHPDAWFLCSIDGEPWTLCESPVTYNFLQDGDHDFQVQAISPLGVPDLTPALYEWDVVLGPDTTPPDTVITKGPPALTANFVVTFEFSGSDDQTHPLELDFECSLDGGPFEGCDSPEEIEVLTAGSHRLEVRAVDLAGNVDPTPAVRTWTVVDFTAPETEILTGPEEETTETTATFEFEGIKPDGTPVFDFDCSLDGADFAPCTSPQTYTGLLPGPHYFQVRARDSAGNIDPSPELWEWLILGETDTTPPDTIIASSPGAVSGPDAIFGFQATEPATFECALDGQPFSECEAVLELQGLSAGEHVLFVRALDLAVPPNVDPTPASHRWTVVGEPETTITSGPENPSGSPSATFTFTSDQADATFQCSLSGTAWVPCTSPYDAGGLVEDVEYEFEVRAVNQFFYLDGTRVLDQTPARWEWLVGDITPPETTITSVTYLPPEDLVEPNSLRFEFTGEDNRTPWFELEFECSLDGGPFEGCSSPHYVPLDELAGGEHEFRVRALDELENADPTPASHTWTTEAAPETAIVSGPALETESREATFTFSSDQAGATFECSLDLAPFSACASGVTFTDLALGEHQLEVRAKSSGGTAVDLSPAVYEWEIGFLTAPVVTIDSGPAIATVETSATFTFSSPDPDALFLCSLDGAPQAFCTSPVELTGLAAGEHTFEVEATKAHLLVDGVPAEWTWTVEDHTAPETTIVSGPEAEIGIETPSVFVFSSNEADASFECSLDGEPYAQCASPPENTLELTGLDAGQHILLVRAVDPSGNVDATPESYLWTIFGPPLTTITSGPAEVTAETSATFVFEADQAGSTFECSLDGADFAQCESPVTYTGLEPSGHLFEVQAINRFGVVEESPVSYAWEIDLTEATPPVTTITFAPEDPWADTTAIFEFTSDQPGSTFECSLDGAPFDACASPAEYTDLAEAEHAFEVRAINADGVVGLPARHEWTIDVPPETEIVLGPPAFTVETTATFQFSSDDPFATFECSLDQQGLSWGSCLPVTEFHDLAPGEHELLVRAKDQAGNVDESPAVWTWTIGALPDTFIDSGPEDPTESRNATFEFSSDQPDATFECALDDAPFFSPCESPLTYSDLAFGEHDFRVRAVDAAGNADPTPAEWEWDIGEIPPSVTILSGPDLLTESRSATFTFAADEPGDYTFECSLDGAAFAPCLSPKSYGGVPLGAHTFRVRVLAGPLAVADAPISSYEWTIADLSAPETTIDVAPPAVTGSTDAAFAFSASEAGSTFECSLDGAAFSGCNSPAQYSGLALGGHRFEVRAIDAAGNADATPAAYEWTIGATPDTTIDAGPEPDTTDAAATFEFSSDQADATFECALDGGPFVACSSPHEYTGLADGDHVVEVRAVSSLGIVDPEPATWEWSIDLPPDTTILTGPSSPTASTQATFTFGASEPDVEFECALDGGDFVDCETPWTITGLAAGPHVLLVRAVDGSGSVDETPATWAWTVLDTTAPETTILSGPPNGPDTSATFTFTGSDNVTPAAELAFECSLDGADFAACNSPQEYTGLAVGTHQFRVRAIDAAGNVDQSPAVDTWTIDPQPDTVAPETAITSGPADPTTDTSASLAFTGSDDRTPALLLAFECRLDGGDWAPCASPKTYSGLAVGPHVFEVRATDEAGNVGAPASHSWTIEPAADTTPPETTIDSGPSGTTTDTSASFAFSSSEAGSAFECSLDGAAFSECQSPATYSGLELGGHVFEVRAIDAAGNIDPTPASRAWTVAAPPDTGAPDTTIVNGPTDSSDTSATFAFEGSDEVSTALHFECRLDGGAWVPCSSPWSYSALAVGPHTFEVRAVDEAGNVDPTPASHAWTVLPPPDTTPPDTVIDSGPPSFTTSTSATFAFSATEEPATFECSLDGASFSACESPQEYGGLGGVHVFAVRAIDAAGNVDPTPASYEWTVDLPPDTTILSGPPASTAGTSATLAFTGSDGLTPTAQLTFECALDGPSFSSCTSPVTYSGLSVGEHTVQVRAKDHTGNLDPTPASYTWTVTPAPSTTILSGPDAETESRDATFTFSSDQPGTSFECSLDGSGFAACESPKTYSGLGLGEHEFAVRAKDADGNVDATPAEYDWEIGYLTAPVVTITSAPDASTAATSATFAFTVDDPDAVLQCSLDGAPFTVCTSPKEYTGLAVGEHTFEVHGIKQHLLVDPAPALHEWTIVDAEAPETTILSGPASTTGSASAAFEFTGSDNGTAAADLDFECSLNGTPFESCSSPYELTGLAAGSYELQVRAIDEAGNVGAPAGYSWTVVTPPETTIESGPDATTTSTSATFVFSSNEAGASFECSLDGAPFTVCVSPYAIGGLPAGPHRFEVRAQQPLGIYDETPAAHEWTIEVPADTTPPETTILTGPPAGTIATSATFTFTSDEADATFECTLDGGSSGSCESPYTLEGLEPGEHELAVAAKDAAGNVDPTPATWTWTVEAAPDCGDEPVVASAAADAWVDQASPTANKGSDSVLKVQAKNKASMRALVRFQLPALPAGCEVESATLRLFAASARSGRTLQALALASAWTESGVTWNNQPAATGAAANAVSGTGWREWNVASQTAAMYAAGGGHGFVVRDASESGGGFGQQFASREQAENVPQLVIRFGPAG